MIDDDSIVLSKRHYNELIEQLEAQKTLRDEMAMAALMGFIASHAGDHPNPYPEPAANHAYAYADSMMEARKK